MKPGSTSPPSSVSASVNVRAGPDWGSAVIVRASGVGYPDQADAVAQPHLSFVEHWNWPVVGGHNLNYQVGNHLSISSLTHIQRHPLGGYERHVRLPHRVRATR